MLRAGYVSVVGLVQGRRLFAVIRPNQRLTSEPVAAV